jgi:Domain of unknown function (DUF4249)
MLCTCIDPFKPNLSGYDSLLVVEGLITNEKASYEIHLSRTMQGMDSVVERVTDAVVSIFDETGHKTNLRNYSGGVYKTDSMGFIGAVGKTYALDIVTHDGKEYKSEQCTMLPVPEIDSLYYEKNIGFTNNQSETHEGISIYLDSKAGDESNKNYRWVFAETWKFKVPDPSVFIYNNDSTIIPVDSVPTISRQQKSSIPVDSVKEFCWKQQNSSDILINSIYAGQLNIIKKEPICFISPDLSDRLSIQYSILVKQYSISDKEAQFWNNLKKVNENNGDIFGSQPFQVISNISNINNPAERVLGYFEVSAVSQRRKYITFTELTKLNLPLYHYDCVRIEISPGDYCKNLSYCIPPTFDQLYKMWTDAKYVFIEPVYSPGTQILQAMIFAPSVCADCEYSGTSRKPDFWIDLN